MAYEETLRNVSFDSDSSLASLTYPAGSPGAASPNYGMMFRLVKITGAHQVGLATAASNEFIIGVIQSKPQKTGQAATVAVAGISMVMSGAAVTAGAQLKADSTGRVVNATLPGDLALVVGTAVGSTTAANNLVPVLLQLN